MNSKLSKIGFGTYRISSQSKEHKKTLIHALENGCNLIDTATNYTDGESEELIGEILSEHPEFTPFLISKAGYIQGKTESVFERLEKFDYIEINEKLKHSMDPLFLEDQIGQSLQRLKKTRLDLFLLHNPEYYFEKENSSQDEYYQLIKKAFIFLEEMVKKGVIGAYGISSNNFPFSLDNPKVTNLEKVYKVACEISAAHHFEYIQFPFNFLEIGPMEKYYQGKNLIELAKEYDLITISNRPLNAFTDQGLLRLAEYDKSHPPIDQDTAKEYFENAMEVVRKKYCEQINDKNECKTFWEIPFFSQFKKIWLSLPTPDAVEEVYYQNFFPLLAQIWGEQGVPPEESEPFFGLFDISMNFSRQLMQVKATVFRKQAVQAGLIDEADKQDLAIIACEHYLNWGVDHVLVGMKRAPYVDQLKALF